MFLFGKMWQFAQGNRHKVALFMFLSICANLVLLVAPWIVAQFLNEIQVNGFGEHNLLLLIGIISSLLAVELVFWALHATSRVIERVCAFWTGYHYTRYLVRGVLDLNMSWHSASQSGDVIDKINNARRGLQDFSDNIFQIIDIVVKIVGTVVVLALFDVRMAAIVLVLLVLSLLIVYQFDRRLVAQFEKLNVFGNKVSALIFDALSNTTTIKIIHIEKTVLKGIAKSLKAPFTLFRRNTFLNEAKWFTSAMAFKLVLVVAMVIYMVSVYRVGGVLEIGTISALYLYLSNLAGAFFGFAYFYEELLVRKTKVMNVAQIEEKFVDAAVERRMIDDFAQIDIEQMKFVYSNNHKEIAQVNLRNLTIGSGERIAIIGASGSGKTTFLKVVHGLYDEATAQISIDSSPVFDTNFADIDLATMLVPQEPEIFATTIRENITMGLDYSDEEIGTVMKLARFDEVADELPKKWESVINEKGVNLSGGQKQRLALSRALLFAQDKKILLLDESTSSVDSVNETEIYQNIFAHFTDQTIIASVHKLNLLKFFDRIIILEDGTITDSGTFDELLNRNVQFRADWEDYIAKGE